MITFSLSKKNDSPGISLDTSDDCDNRRGRLSRLSRLSRGVGANSRFFLWRSVPREANLVRSRFSCMADAAKVFLLNQPSRPPWGILLPGNLQLLRALHPAATAALNRVNIGPGRLLAGKPSQSVHIWRATLDWIFGAAGMVSTWNWIRDGPVNAHRFAATRRRDFLACQQAVRFHTRQERLGGVRRGRNSGAVNIPRGNGVQTFPLAVVF